MFIPKHFKVSDKEKLVAFMREFNFAAIVNSTKKRYWATHIPFLIATEGDNIILKAHMAKANPQWSSFGSDEVLVIFQEPHAYISPSLYDNSLSVPTWNYIAVHAYGVPEVMPADEDKIALLEESFEVFEPAYKVRWVSLPDNYRNELLSGIVAFRIKVTNLEGKFKLSQNRSENERAKIIQNLASTDDKIKTDIARHMESTK